MAADMKLETPGTSALSEITDRDLWNEFKSLFGKWSLIRTYRQSTLRLHNKQIKQERLDLLKKELLLLKIPSTNK